MMVCGAIIKPLINHFKTRWSDSSGPSGVHISLPVASSGWLDWWEMDWETFQSEVWTADCLQCHWLWIQFEFIFVCFFQKKGRSDKSCCLILLCLDTSMYLNWWTMETYSCETSLQPWENHGPARTGGGRTMPTLTLCILQKEKSCRHLLVSYLSV